VTTGRNLLDELHRLWLADGQMDHELTVLDILDDLASLDIEGASEMYFLALKKSDHGENSKISQKR
jgi:hypothetical protein